VSRIGAAEVPTDPMSMEESDVIVKLKPKSDGFLQPAKMS
jgi:cobalt-zinc-cadmium resistance protein CzcA